MVVILVGVADHRVVWDESITTVYDEVVIDAPELTSNLASRVE